MGSWNGTCAVSNLHVRSGQEVAVFMLLENKGSKSFCYGNALYDVCPLPFYGKYNDYGAVEDCHGPALPIVLGEIKRQLYEFGQGPNSSHDIIVKRSDFDIDLLFEADHEDRLGIQDSYTFDSDEYDLRELRKDSEKDTLTVDQQFELDRLASKLKQVDTFRRVTHVIIHGDIFRDIMEKYYVDIYVGDGKGTVGYNNNYNRIFFKDIADSIPAYIDACKEEEARINAMADPHEQWAERNIPKDEWKNPNLATKWLNSFRNSNEGYGLLLVDEYIREYKSNGLWDDLESFVKEALTGAWVNGYMSSVRKLWSKQTGAGSQNDEHDGYNILIQSMSDVLAAEKKAWDEENEE